MPQNSHIGDWMSFQDIGLGHYPILKKTSTDNILWMTFPDVGLSHAPEIWLGECMLKKSHTEIQFSN